MDQNVIIKPWDSNVPVGPDNQTSEPSDTLSSSFYILVVPVHCMHTWVSYLIGQIDRIVLDLHNIVV